MDEEYLLKWKDYQSNFFSLAEELFMSESLTDVTLCCRDQVGRKKNILNTSIYAFFDYTCYVVQYRHFFGKLEEGMEQAAAATIVYIGRIHNMCVLLLQAYEAHRLVLSVCSPYFRAIFTRASGVTVRGGGAQARLISSTRKWI